MAISHFRMSMAGYGRPFDVTAFVRALGVEDVPYEVYEAGLRIGYFDLADFGDPFERPEVHDDYEAAIQRCLLSFAAWLSRIPTENMHRVRTDGLKVWVIVNLWIDSDQMDFNLPPALSSELGRLDLELYVLSNE